MVWLRQRKPQPAVRLAGRVQRPLRRWIVARAEPLVEAFVVLLIRGKTARGSEFTAAELIDVVLDRNCSFGSGPKATS